MFPRPFHWPIQNHSVVAFLLLSTPKLKLADTFDDLRLSQLISISTHMGYERSFYASCGYNSPTPEPARVPSVNYTIDPNVTTFAQMTEFIDGFRSQFLRLQQQLLACNFGLTPQESKTLNDISVAISQFDRSRAFDGRGQWVFSAIANEHDAWVAELLISMGLGIRIYCGFPYTSNSVTKAYGFLYELQKRVVPF